MRDLTSDALEEYDVSRLRVFLVSPDVDVKHLAGADLGEAQVLAVLDHRGSARKRSEMEFEVRWSDEEVTWEPWDVVRRLALLDEYIESHPEAKLRSLLNRSKAV